MAERLVEDIFAALDEQTVTVPGTQAAALIVPSLANFRRAAVVERVISRLGWGLAGGVAGSMLRGSGG